MTAVRVQPTANGLTYKVTFGYDPGIVELIKLLPQRARRWDKHAGVWRVNTSHIDDLIELLEANAHRVIGGRVPPRPPKSEETETWADLLLTAVGPQRIDRVHRALTKVLHPDTDTGDNQLMQQLNTARDRQAVIR